MVSASPLSLHEVARVGPAALRSGRLPIPHVVREERSVVMVQVWGDARQLVGGGAWGTQEHRLRLTGPCPLDQDGG